MTSTDGTGPQLDVADVAQKLVNLGYFPLPCEGKRPVGIGWQRRTDPFEIPFLPHHNIGIRCGDGGLFALLGVVFLVLLVLDYLDVVNVFHHRR